jgi:hypothetical protein
VVPNEGAVKMVIVNNSVDSFKRIYYPGLVKPLNCA